MNGNTTEENKTVPKSRINMKKVLIVVIVAVLFVAFVIGLTVFLVLSAGDKTCNTVECVKATNDILSFVDIHADPCNDFYQFACGSYFERTKRDDFRTVDGDIKKMIDQDINDMIEAPINRYDSHPTKLMKTFYQSCLNETLVNQVGLQRLKWLLHEVGEWPVLEGTGWSERKFDWKKMIQKLRDIGAHFDIFFQVGYKPREDDEDKYLITIGNRIFRKYQDYKMQHEFMIDIGIQFGALKSMADRDFSQVLNLHSKLVDATNVSDIYDVPSYNPKTLREVHLMYPGINWTEFLGTILYPNTVNMDAVVNIENPYIFSRVLEVINNTPKRTVANYILWYVAQAYLDLLPERFRVRQTKYKSMVYKEPEEPRNEVCLEFLQSSVPLPLILQYSKTFYPDKKKAAIRKVLSDIKKEYQNILEDIDWIDEEGKKIVQNKLVSSQDFITADEYFALHDIRGLYDQVRINASDPLETIWHLKLESLNNLQKAMPILSKYVLQHDPKSNKIVLVPMKTQGIYFSKDRPQYMNYGAMGSSLAYHLSDILLEGKNYDLYGNPRQQSTPETLLNFDEKLKCLANQYKKFYVPELQDYEETDLTKKNNFAYLLSRHVAYKAYMDWVDDHGVESVLPGLNFTTSQLFWISSAITECSKLPQDFIKRELEEKGVPPSRLRVNVPLRNIEEFSEDFNCPSEATMHPPLRCTL